MASRAGSPGKKEWDLGRILSVITLVAVPLIFGLAIGSRLGARTEEVTGYLTLTETVTETVLSTRTSQSPHPLIVNLQCDSKVARGEFFRCIVTMQYQFEVVAVNLNATITDPDGATAYTTFDTGVNLILGEPVTWFVPRDAATGTYTFSVIVYGVNGPAENAAAKFEVT